MSKKTALILEGGGMRGAYTAGCLSWLLNHQIEFDTHYGISTGAVNLCAYLMKSEDHLFNFFTRYINDKKAIGLSALLRDGVLVSYDYLFNFHMKNAGFSLDSLKEYKRLAKIGLYDLSKGMTEFHRVQDIDLDMLKAATTLPILGRPVVKGTHKYLDGGITKMIAVEEALKDGAERCIIIATKPLDYVRKPANIFVRFLMKIIFRDCPNLEKDYAVRHLNYRNQVQTVRDMEARGEAMYLCPSEKTKVTRLKATNEQLVELYQLGVRDMEARKDEILAFLGIN